MDSILGGEENGFDSKVCGVWNSPPAYQGYVCLILASIKEEWIFVMNLGSGGSISSDGSSGGGRPLLDDRSVYPADRCPNLRIPRGFVNGNRDVHCCAVKSTLYIFKLRENQNGIGLGFDVYSIYLRELIKLSDVLLDNKMLKQHPLWMSFKNDPVPLPFSDGILLFSTKILFYDVDDGIDMKQQSFDFELVDPIRNVSKRLPPLLIRPFTNSQYCETFQLFHPQSSHWEEFPIFECCAAILPFFSIQSYALHKTEFLIQTSFRRMFSIDTLSPKAEWRLLDQGINSSEYADRGLKFTRMDRNFISFDGRVCIDAYGVTRFRDECVGSAVRERVDRVDFPLPFAPGVRRSLALLDENTPCFIQVGPDSLCFDDLHCEYYEVLGNPNWCLDLFRVDFAKLLADGDDDENDDRK